MMKRHLLFGSLAVACGLVATTQLLPSAEGVYTPRASEEPIISEGISGAIEYMNKLRANPETGVVDPQDVLNARRAVEKMPISKAFVEWDELGPDNVGGRTRAILIDKNNPSRMYAGGVSGGIWYSNNAGQSWYRQDNNGIDMNLAVVSMTQAANGDIYVGTGEGMFYSASGFKSQGILGEGVYKSTDGGETFELLPSTKPSSSNNSAATWSSVGKMAADPVDANRIYAATNKGLMITSDGGLTWEDEGLTGSSVSRDVDVASDGSVFMQYSSKIFYSPNGDPESFGTSIQDGLDVPSSSSQRMEIAIAPSDPNTVYVMTTSQGVHSGLHVSYDKGQTWETISAGSSTNFNPLNGQAGYNLALSVFPNNKDKVLIGGVQLWSWEKGKNFKRIGSEARFPGNTRYVHADKHAFTFHPTNPDIFYIASDGGVGFTNDGGVNFFQRNKGYNVTQFYTLAVDGLGNPIGGTQDNSCPYIDGSGVTKQAARIVNGGDGAAVGASKYRADNLFYSSQYGNTLRSSNGGQSGNTFWPQIMTNADLEHEDYISTAPGASSGFAGFIAAAVLWEDKSDLDNYFTLAGVSNGIWMGRNCWDFAVDPIMHRISERGNPQTITISDDGNVAYAGYLGRVERITGLLGATDSLTSHYKSDSSSISVETIWTGSRLVTDVAINPDDAGEIVITLGQYTSGANVYYSDNALDSVPSFTNVKSNLPSMPVYAAIFVKGGPNEEGNVLLGTEFGVMGTEDITAGSVTWEAQNTGFDRVPTFALKQMTDKAHPYYGYVYAATHGRGMFRSSTKFVGIEETEASNVNELLNFYPNPASDNVTVDLNLMQASPVSVEIYNLSGKLVKQVNMGTVLSGAQSLRLNISDLNEGLYVTKVIAGSIMKSGKIMVK